MNSNRALQRDRRSTCRASPWPLVLAYCESTSPTDFVNWNISASESEMINWVLRNT